MVSVVEALVLEPHEQNPDLGHGWLPCGLVDRPTRFGFADRLDDLKVKSAMLGMCQVKFICPLQVSAKRLE